MLRPVPIVCFDLSTFVCVLSLVVAASVYGAFACITARKSVRRFLPGKPMDGSHSCRGALLTEQEERGRCAAPVSGFLCCCCRCHHCPQVGPALSAGIPVDGSHSCLVTLSPEQEERGRCVTPVSGFLCRSGLPS